MLVTFKDNPGGTDKLGFARLDLSQNTNSSARIYSKLTDITYTGVTKFVNDNEKVFISYQSMTGKTEILSLNYTSGNVLNKYSFNQLLGDLRMHISSSIMHGFYSQC